MIDKLKQRSNQFTIVLNDNECHWFKNCDFIINKLISDYDVDVVYIAVIYHDKDLDENKQPKTPHYHVILELDKICTVGSCLKWLSSKFMCNENQISIDKCNDLAMQSRYLIHLDEIDKVPYFEFDVHTNNVARYKDYLKLKKIKDMKDLISFVKECHYDLEIIMSKLAHYDKYRKYINDLIVNYYRKQRNW